jgi:Dyp-type peroxidase family
MRSRTRSTRLGGVSNLAVTAPVKPGFVVGFETITYVDRLGRLLNALNAARVALREASLLKPPFPDSIGHFDILRNFRYTIIPPEGEGPRDPVAALKAPGTSRLSLNVTFDAGWEPYMRVIYRDIGTLLDALFCNCIGYPGSRSSSYDDYCTWVRNNELDAGLYYTESATTLGDAHYLERLERIQRTQADPAAADRAIAELAVEPAHVQRANALAQAKANPRPSFFASMRALKGFYRLAPLFPPNADDESGILIRFAQAVLGEFHELDQAGVYTADATLRALMEKFFAEELAWFRVPQPAPARSERLHFDRTRLQAGIVDAYQKMTHGCVVLLGVEQGKAAAAVRFLAGLPASRQGTPAADGIERNVAFTYPGLAALGIPPERLDRFPQEFFEGMEKRASLLGDVRTNHPDNWTRPLRNWPPSATPATDRIDLSTVHVVVVLRLADPANPGATLHPRLAAAIDPLQAGTGLKVLSVQPTRSERVDDTTTREHFGFLDGLSQPHPVGPDEPRTGRDDVALGEILLGYCNDRDDGPFPKRVDVLLDEGSFLVMRKLRQHVDRLNELEQGHPGVAEKMMGRRKDGTSFVPVQPPDSNDFDFTGDPRGVMCPFASHARRTHPRDGRPYVPRIARRGMSYGPRFGGANDPLAERGIVFMAYCASISEQFEVVQRWVTGGNSSGVASSQADPFLAVPEPGQPRVFRYPADNGTVVRIDLGDRPLVSLEWGLYLFAPSLAALKHLPQLAQTPPAQTARAPAPHDLSLETWQGLLEDGSPDPADPLKARNALPWQYVREQGSGVLATGYGLLAGTEARVLEVLKDNGERFSVMGYGQRMAASIGLGYLGLDPHTGHAEQAEHTPSVNEAIEGYDARKSFAAARPIVDGFIAAVTEPAKLEQMPPRVPVDLISLSETVLAKLCAVWFGLPDGKLMQPGGRVPDPFAPARCPGHLFTTSRFIFGPRPNDAVIVQASSQGRAVLEAFKQLLAGGGPLGPLAQDIKDRLQHIPSVAAGDRDFLVARTLAGTMLGFPPTVHGNFLRIVDLLVRSEELWDLQQRLLERRAAGVVDAFERAHAALFMPMIATMRRRPAPEMIWRTAVNGATLGGAAPTDADRRVVLGLASAVSDPASNHLVMFGGSRTGPDKTVHACPGYGMAIGVLLALLSGLFEAGGLRPTGSSIGLTLIR